VKPKLISVAVASCFVAGAAFANPTGPSVVKGNATIVQNGNLLQITNTPNAILNWQSFSIGANEITRFIQQSASSAVLNRVVTQNPSTILGALQSNGRVFIVNPNGILFGAGAQVDVAGLVASTLNLSDSDFLAGRMRFAGGLGAGVVNQGNITTGAGGNVYLVGSAVTNNGIITSPQGEVILAAGNSVELVNPGTPNLRVEIAAADNQAINLGQILSDAGRVGIYAGLINNSGSIRADSAVSEGGRILLKATKSATLESTSVLSAQGHGGGEIKVLGGDKVEVAGRLDASAPNDGNGGFIETSAKKVHVDAGTVVTTTALKGKTGTWLIDPDDFVIQAQGGDITGAELGRNLSTTSVIITSDSVGPTPVPDPTGNGDIFVNDSVIWTAPTTGPTSLTLLARRNVNIVGSISGGGDLVFLAGWNGDLQSPVVTNGIGDITSSSNSVITGGNVFFEAGRDIQLVSSVVAASSSTSSGNRIAQLVAGGSINLTNPNGNVLVAAAAGPGGTGTVNLLAKTGNISLDGANIQANGGDITTANGGAAGVTLNAGIGITLNNSTVSAIGGGGINGGSGTAMLVAGSGISFTGSSVSASGGGGGIGAGGNATVTLSAGGDIALASAVNASSGAGSPAGTAQILLTFLTPTGNFSVNGVPGAIVDTSLVGEGFFVDGLPAILDVNFFVTKPSNAPVFNDVLVATMNQQVDVLGDQLKTGEIGVTDQNGQKKLSVCN
jgi:filamentous hemagglutinin family protein